MNAVHTKKVGTTLYVNYSVWVTRYGGNAVSRRFVLVSPMASNVFGWLAWRENPKHDCTNAAIQRGKGAGIFTCVVVVYCCRRSSKSLLTNTNNCLLQVCHEQARAS